MLNLDTRRLSPEMRDALAKFATGETGAATRIYKATSGDGTRVAIVGVVLLVLSQAGRGVIYGAEAELLLRAARLGAIGCIAYALVGWIARRIWPTDAVSGMYFTAGGAFELNGRRLRVYEANEVGQPHIEKTLFKQGARVTETHTAFRMYVPDRTCSWGWRNAGAPFSQWLQSLDFARKQLVQAVQRGDTAAAMLLDPLIVGRVTGRWEQPAAQPGGARFHTPPFQVLVAAQTLLFFAAPALYVEGTAAWTRQQEETREADRQASTARRLRSIREAGEQCLARHPNAPGARLIATITRAATETSVSLPYNFTGVPCWNTSLCDTAPADVGERRRGVEEALGHELTRILQTAVGPTDNPFIFAHRPYVQTGAVLASSLEVQMEHARDNNQVPGTTPVLRWRFTGVLAAENTRVPINFTFTPDADPATPDAARHLAQYQTAMLAFTRQYLAPLFGVDLSNAPVPEALRPSN